MSSEKDLAVFEREELDSFPPSTTPSRFRITLIMAQDSRVSDPIFQGDAVFERVQLLSVHHFFYEQADSVKSWTVSEFIKLYPVDLALFADGLDVIRSFKQVRLGIRMYCKRFLVFLLSNHGQAYLAVILAKVQGITTAELMREFDLIARRKTITNQDATIRGKATYHMVPV